MITMNHIIKRIHIDLYSPTSYEVIHAQQGDHSARIVEFALYDQGIPYRLEGRDILVQLEGHRGDKSSFMPKECSVAGHIISVVLDSDILYESGTASAKIALYDLTDNTLLSTIPFQIAIQKNPCDKNKIESEKKSLIDWLIFQFNHLKNDLSSHHADTQNPHQVTKAQVGLGNVPNVTTNNQTPTYEMSESLSELESGEPLSIAFGKIAHAVSGLIRHMQDHIRHVTSTEREHWEDSYQKRHTHNNKSILDQTTACYTSEEKNKLSSLYTTSEIDNKFSALETNIDWKESVDTFDTISTAYPNPEDGWTVNVKDTDYTYRYNGTNWVAISANAIPKATDSVDGLFSKEDYVTFKSLSSGGVAGIKGDAEETYRTGTVNLTPENIGALSPSGNAASASKLQTPRTLDGIRFDGSSSVSHFGSSPTAMSTQAKTVSIPGFVLEKGAKATVKFPYGNSAASPTLNVSGTGTKAIYYNGAPVSKNFIKQESVHDLIYDGSHWLMKGEQGAGYYHVSCGTRAVEREKIVPLAGFRLVNGALLILQFKYGNRVENPTLNVAGTGAYPIYYMGAPVPPEYIMPNSAVPLVFDGQNRWVIIGDFIQQQLNELKQFVHYEEYGWVKMDIDLREEYLYENHGSDIIHCSKSTTPYAKCVSVSISGSGPARYKIVSHYTDRKPEFEVESSGSMLLVQGNSIFYKYDTNNFNNADSAFIYEKPENTVADTLLINSWGSPLNIEVYREEIVKIW